VHQKVSRNRYSILSPLPLDEQKDICIMLCAFFSPQNGNEIRKYLGLPVQAGRDIPLPFIEFLKFHKLKGLDLWPKLKRITELATKLKQKNILTSSGHSGINECFWFMHELSNLQRLGTLWLGETLGAQFIGNEIYKDIAYITGITSTGDASVGTGTLISPNIILTCAHVLSDMKVDNSVIVSGQKAEIGKIVFHGAADVGLIFLKNDTSKHLNDLAFRESAILEEVIIAGYPKVPRSLDPVFTLQRGEISGFMKRTMDKYPFDLFSAIARPGNSGGPVVGLDGRIVGIVTRSLERQKEEADAMVPMPFFASVPSSVIRDCVLELTDNSVAIPWEDYS